MRTIAASACTLLLAVSTHARADEVSACVEASSQGQTLRDARKLIEAKAQFQACARASCPTVVQKDCVMWLDEVQKELPTIVLSAKDAKGADLLKVRVVADGAVLATTLDGKALPMNPGGHTFRFELANGQKVEQQSLVRQGQKNQSVTAAFAPEPGSEATKPSGVTGKPVAITNLHGSTEGAGSGFPWKPIGWVTAGVGVAALGVGAVFALQMQAKTSDRDKLCPNGICSTPGDLEQVQHDQDDARTAATLATVGFIAGGVALASGVAMVLAAPSSQSTKANLQWAPWFQANGGGASMRGHW